LSVNHLPKAFESRTRVKYVRGSGITAQRDYDFPQVAWTVTLKTRNRLDDLKSIPNTAPKWPIHCGDQCGTVNPTSLRDPNQRVCECKRVVAVLHEGTTAGFDV